MEVGGEPEEHGIKGKKKSKSFGEKGELCRMLEDIKQVYDKKRSLDLMTMQVTYVYGDKMF